MFASTLFIAVSALSTLASAQNYSTSGPLSITVSQVPLALRQSWCTAQLSSCPEICGSGANPNTCDPNTLDYTCTCQNGNKPNISDYTSTMPFFICEEWIGNCLANNAGMLAKQQACKEVVCGSKKPSKASSNSGSGSGSSSSSSAAAKATNKGGNKGGSGGGKKGNSGSSSSSSSSSFAQATALAQNYGTQVLAGGMLVAFGFAL